MVGRLVGKAHQANQGSEEAFGLRQWQMEHRSQGQCGYDRKVGIPALTPWTAARRRIPCANRLVVEPDRDVAAFYESDIVRRPVLHSVLRRVFRRHLGLRPGSHQRSASIDPQRNRIARTHWRCQAREPFTNAVLSRLDKSFFYCWVYCDRSVVSDITGSRLKLISNLRVDRKDEK